MMMEFFQNFIDIHDDGNSGNNRRSVPDSEEGMITSPLSGTNVSTSTTRGRWKRWITQRKNRHIAIILVAAVVTIIVTISVTATVRWTRHQQHQQRHPETNEPIFADQFPQLDETLHLAHLSRLVYKFRHDDVTNCTSFNTAAEEAPKKRRRRQQQGNNNNNNHENEGQENHYINVECQWYYHSQELGTQVLILSNSVQKYITIVFAGTDDIRTSLQDANILTTEFGNNDTVFLPPPSAHEDDEGDEGGEDEATIRSQARVHAGFNHAVFMDDVWENIYNQTLTLLKNNPTYKLFTTGHSLGGSNSIMTAIAFASLGHPIQSINFGCPQTGNYYWKEYFKNDTKSSPDNSTSTSSPSPLQDKLGVWRVVLGWDLIARLPAELFYHVGHTVQLDVDSSNKTTVNPRSRKQQQQDSTTTTTPVVSAYYQHYGLEDKYASVPFGWSSMSYAYLPWALGYHHISKYIDHLEDLYNVTTMMNNSSSRSSSSSSTTEEGDGGNSNNKIWPIDFVPIQPTKKYDDGDDDDDDYYINPPDDYIAADTEDSEFDDDSDYVDEFYLDVGTTLSE